MLLDVVKAEYLKEYEIEVTFEDGVVGIVDFDKLIKFEGVFSTFRNLIEFKKFFVNQEVGTICWPNGADFSSDVLYAVITKKPIDLSDSKKKVG
jgi:hypothetical protein